MRRFAALLLVVPTLALGACSSDSKKDATDQTTTTTGGSQISTSSTSATASSITPTTVASSTTKPPAPTTSTTTKGNSSAGSATLRGISYSPQPPIRCNATTTMIELKWTATNATRVELHIDDATKAFATYGSGRRDELVPLACDGKLHRYTIAAVAPDGTTSRTISVRTA